MAPKDVTVQNEWLVSQRLPRETSKKKRDITSTVRLALDKQKAFDKGYWPNWTLETFQVKPSVGSRYRLIDGNGEMLEGSFYPEELQEVKEDKDKAYVIEKIIERRAEKQPYATFKLDSLNQRIYLSFDSSDAINFLHMLPAISFQIEGPMVGMLGWPDFSQEFQLDKLCRRNIRDAKITAPFQPAVDMAFDMFTGDAIVPVVNHGLGERRKKMGESSEFELQSRLHVDLCLQDRYLIDGVDVRIQLERQQPKFYLMWNENNETYKVELIKAYLEVPFVTLAPSTYTRIAEQLQSNNAKYPLKRVVVKDIRIPSRRRFHVLDNLFINEVLPKRLILGLVENDSYDGNSIKNPFKYHHHRLEYIKLMKNGDVVEEYFMDLPNKQATTPYLDLMKRVGILNSKEDLDMSYNDYIKGYTLFGFDLTNDHGADQVNFHPKSSGSVSLELRFENAPPNPLNLLLFAEYDNVLEIDVNRQIYVDW
ncbi:hypothetical protein LOTGIDRAFT_145931 [Lottia gigantea]|uniref:Uncharacterized protein n=1 Tax=Lottia gigantea TaxID=225164 RepID=V4BHG7_LOTGI|nr:hypothetical protein LOTGIDRAFT_145931 [Lottia gigantea]ESO88069.1 hypothetical protein LOTGIDRAFT_145931 [Lottia gigantea]